MRGAVTIMLAAAAASASPARAQAPLYRATLAAPAVDGAAVVRELRWQCAGTVCTAPFTATSSDATVCAAVARKLGPVAGFVAGPHAFGADELERCNHARR